jgi:hypothetical protein
MEETSTGAERAARKPPAARKAAEPKTPSKAAEPKTPSKAAEPTAPRKAAEPKTPARAPKKAAKAAPKAAKAAQTTAKAAPKQATKPEPAAKAPAKRTAAASAPARTQTTAATPVAKPEAVPEPIRTPPVPVWARVVADPGYAPEHVVRAAVARLGPQASAWLAQAKQRYPDASADGLARLAAQEFRTTARRQGVAVGSAGLLGSLALTGTLAQAQTRLVLSIAAAYGEDPSSPDRVDDILHLLRIPRLTEPAMAATGHAARTAGGFAVRRIAARLVPFGGAIAGTIQATRSTEDVAARAINLYRQRRNPSRFRSRV